MANEITNVSLNQNKQKSAENNRSTNQDVFDQISSLLAKIKGDANKVSTDGKFYGFVLYSHRMTVNQFNELFKENEEFITNVTANSGKTKLDVSGTILEIYVEVPQLSDFLPRPDVKVLFDIMKIKADERLRVISENLQPFSQPFDDLPGRVGVSNRELNPNIPRAQSGQTDKIKRNRAQRIVSSKLEKTLETISMYPRVYAYVEEGKSYVPGQACEVYFPAQDNKAFPTMGYGYFTKVLDGYQGLAGDGVEKEIQEIIKGAG